MKKLAIILFWIAIIATAMGVVGFAIGFYGPLINTPEANQGPLLCIFVTGPEGAILGEVIGAIVGNRKASQS